MKVGMGSAPTWREAMQIAAQAPTPLPALQTPLADCPGEVLAATVHSPIPIPHFASSAMDGFAVAGRPPWRLDPDATGPLQTGWARAVVTGGQVPQGASGIVRSEYTCATGGDVDLAAGAPVSELAPGRHIRAAGRESAAGEAVAVAGTVLSPAHVAYAAVAGFDALPIRRRPRVALIQTGDEVRATGIPAAGEVRDAFGPQLPAYVHLLGGTLVAQARIGDDAAATRAALSTALADQQVDLVLTTGATGHSTADHVRRVVEAMAVEMLFGELDMRPGHPTMFTRLPGEATWHVGLPGNPLAAMTAMRVVVQPFLHALRGLPPEDPDSVVLRHGAPGARVERLTPARTAGDVDGGPEDRGEQTGGTGPLARREQSAGTEQPAAGKAAWELEWELCDAAGSNMLRGLSQADGLVVLPREPVVPGARVPCLRLPWAHA